MHCEQVTSEGKTSWTSKFWLLWLGRVQYSSPLGCLKRCLGKRKKYWYPKHAYRKKIEYKRRYEIFYLLIKAFLCWILINIIVWAKLKDKFTPMVSSHLNCDGYGFSLCVFSNYRSCCKRVWCLMFSRISIPSISTNSTFSIVYFKLMVKTTTEPLVVIVIWRSIKSISPGWGSRWRLRESTMSGY